MNNEQERLKNTSDTDVCYIRHAPGAAHAATGIRAGMKSGKSHLPEGCDNIWDFNVADDGVMRIAVTEEETREGLRMGKQKLRRVLGAELVHIRTPCISRSLKK